MNTIEHLTKLIRTTNYRILSNNIGTVDPTPRPLPVNIHGNSRKTSSQGQPTDNEKRLLDTLLGNPIVNVERQSERKRVLDEVHACKCFGRLVTVGINDIGDDTRRSELNSEIDETETYYDWDRPWTLVCCRLTPSEEPDCCEDEVTEQNWETEFRFCCQYGI
jgi:hypothetical protein